MSEGAEPEVVRCLRRGCPAAGLNQPRLTRVAAARQGRGRGQRQVVGGGPQLSRLPVTSSCWYWRSSSSVLVFSLAPDAGAALVPHAVRLAVQGGVCQLVE